ncbi:MAG TPA: hypothetical protein VHW01_18985 [Polyangiaceae bacterium]|jgi:hypothetical protein|nr:hypothetical protein [Polyangiaceae bacterium]
MGAPTPGFVKWLTRLLADLTEGGIITRFELIHKVEAEHADRLDIWRNDADSARDPQELAQEIQDSAERDAQSRTTGQPQRYIVYAYRGTADLHESQHAFLVKSTFHVTRFGEDSEPATEKGVIAHYMRHDENVHRLLMSAGDSLLGKLAVDLERERACRIKAEELNWSMVEKYQTLLDREHERRVDEAKELMKARRLDELMGVATALLPIFATKFLGQTSVQEPKRMETTDPKDAAIRRFFANLSETEISGILGCLSGANQIALAELHRAFSAASPDAAEVMARQLAVRKFLKGLSEREVTAIFASLGEANRALLLALYSQYRDVEQTEQDRKPEILRS